MLFTQSRVQFQFKNYLNRHFLFSRTLAAPATHLHPGAICVRSETTIKELFFGCQKTFFQGSKNFFSGVKHFFSGVKIIKKFKNVKKKI